MQPPVSIVVELPCLPQAQMTKKAPISKEVSRYMTMLAVKRKEKLSPERRSEIARKAAKARWAKPKKK